MKENMTLKELGESYLDETERLKELIENCRERQKLAMRGGNSAEAKRQERLMEEHRCQLDDLLTIGLRLLNYYKKSGAEIVDNINKMEYNGERE